MLSIMTWWHLVMFSPFTFAAFFNIVNVVLEGRGVIFRCSSAHSLLSFWHKSKLTATGFVKITYGVDSRLPKPETLRVNQINTRCTWLRSTVFDF